jgi:hypothetical protein
MDINIITPNYFMLNCKFIVSHLSYEDYLIEVINGSMYFKTKCHHLEQYKLEREQSHSENDVVSSKYCMDFKLLVDQDDMNSTSKNKPEVDYSKMSQGFIFVKTKEVTPIQPSRNILSELIGLSAEMFYSSELSSTVKNLLKNLRKDKNLFIYYPYEFMSENDVEPELFEKPLTSILKTVLNYRTEEQRYKDTYICIKANKYFYIYEWDGAQLVFRDSVHEILCRTYLDVKLYSVY